MISYFAIYLGSRPASQAMSFGYHRAEILGALASVLLIWGLIIWLVVEAVQRLIGENHVDGEIMLITAVIGLVCNIVNLFTLHSCGGGHSHSHHNIQEEVIEEKLERKLSHCHQPLFENIQK